MSTGIFKLQPAVRKETRFVAIATAGGAVVMLGVFLILHSIWPEWAPFDYTVFLGALGGFVVAVGNFLWMGVTVQRVVEVSASQSDPQGQEDRARRMMAVSLRYRLLVQLLWVVIAIVAPFINMVSGIVPLFIPSVVIKLRGMRDAGKPSDRTGESTDTEKEG